MNNCLGCNLYFKCNNPLKGKDYICKKFKLIKALDIPEDGISISKEELDLMHYVDEESQNNVESSMGIQIDYSSIKKFPNFYEFVTEPDGLAPSESIYAKQLAYMLLLFGEVCPKCSDKRFFNIDNVPKNFKISSFPKKISILEHGVCPSCGSSKSKLLKHGLKFFQELDLLIGQRSGKSATLRAYGIPYILHHYLTTANMHALYKIPRSEILEFTMVAQTFAKAVGLLFGPFVQAIKESFWFRKYHDLLDSYSNEYGIELYRIKDHIIHYKNKNIMFKPMSPNKRVLRGDTRIGYAIDELDWFPLFKKDNEERERADGNEVYLALERSCKTIRNKARRLLISGHSDIINAYGLNIGSPQHYNGTLSKLTRLNANTDYALTGQVATWDFNPEYTKESFSSEFNQNPQKAWRDFGAVPPKNLHSWLQTKSINDFFTDKHRLVLHPHSVTNRHGEYRKFAKIASGRNMRGNPENVMCIDAGYSGNSFAFAIGHTKEIKEVTHYQIVAVGEVIPSEGSVIDYSKICTKLLFPLIELFNVKFVSADRWQSIKILHDIEEEYGISTHMYSMKYPDFSALKQLFLASGKKLVILPTIEVEDEDYFDLNNYPMCYENFPLSHLNMQLKTVQDTGKSVEKGIGFTDDIFRAFALLMRFLQDAQFMMSINGHYEEERAKPALFASSFGFGGSGSPSGSSNITASSSSYGGGRSSTQLAGTFSIVGKK